MAVYLIGVGVKGKAWQSGEPAKIDIELQIETSLINAGPLRAA